MKTISCIHLAVSIGCLLTKRKAHFFLTALSLRKRRKRKSSKKSGSMMMKRSLIQIQKLVKIKSSAITLFQIYRCLWVLLSLQRQKLCKNKFKVLDWKEWEINTMRIKQSTQSMTIHYHKTFSVQVRAMKSVLSNLTLPMMPNYPKYPTDYLL